jgi:hypothetical protein
MKPRKVIILTYAASLIAISLAGAARGAFPEPRQFLGVTIVFVILGFGAEFAPGLAIPFAILVLVAIIFARGEEALLGVARKPKLAVIPGGKKEKQTLPKGSQPTKGKGQQA